MEPRQTLTLMGAKSGIAMQDWYNAPKKKPIHFLQASLCGFQTFRSFQSKYRIAQGRNQGLPE
jgi:hypothetical protein